MASPILITAPQGPTGFAFGEAAFNQLRFVVPLILEVETRIAGRKSRTLSEKLFTELFQRVRCWVETLGRLANANDFQAVLAGDRALFETTVDLTLMRFAKNDFPPEKMFAWDESARLAACEAIERHFANRKMPVPPDFEPQMKFLVQNKVQIATLREKHFKPEKKSGKWKHPRRWTDCTLPDAARAAQASTPVGFAWSIDLERFYATRYPEVCWNVHGSGAAGLRFLPTASIPFLAAKALHECMDFAMRCAQLVLVECGMFGADAKASFEKCDGMRGAIAMAVMHHHDPTFGEKAEGKTDG